MRYAKIIFVPKGNIVPKTILDLRVRIEVGISLPFADIVTVIREEEMEHLGKLVKELKSISGYDRVRFFGIDGFLDMDNKIYLNAKSILTIANQCLSELNQ